jgi:hypothetical protein
MLNPEPFHRAPVNPYGRHYCHPTFTGVFFIKVRLAPQAQQVTVTIRQKMLLCRA